MRPKKIQRRISDNTNFTQQVNQPRSVTDYYTFEKIIS